MRGCALLLVITLVGCEASDEQRPDGGPGAPSPGAPSLPNAAVVMTRNLYLGADVTPLLSGDSTVDFVAAAAQVLEQVAATDYPERADALAAEIVAQQPHLVGLQEVIDVTLDGANADAPFLDYLEGLLAALAAQGASYRPVATVRNLELGVSIPIVGEVALADHDVILARADVTATPVALTGCRQSLDGCNLATAARLPSSPIGDIAVERGFVVVDATLPGGQAVRFASTHLEIQGLGPEIQSAQAAELIAVLGALPDPRGAPLIVVGDFNSGPDDATIADVTPPYAQLTSVYHDVWLQAGGGAPGLTCCHEADLRNTESTLTHRIDLVFTGTVPEEAAAVVLGDEPQDRTPSGLWPSDHAGVAATVLLPPP